ncbi:hypothetical protein J416_05248 [Gracilibacillus halophilus YIM-C55.5]|uniref:DUF4227 family protein n=1 Tax=Gracilibacillus halophilus YIM-C55.5 TaxID=1308866 RepID=N4WDR6_9BACI|nr:DUF4227 family protein [Gracilibacillus halophilus]ENH97394.1 hypothetical protein J416_05248 [Gracilibacillus halophilus YIM-C55.5]
MNKMLRMCYEMMKVILLFIICTVIFYYCIKAVHEEYGQLGRYEEPQGKAIKVMDQEDETVMERLSIFFRLGE